VGGAGAQEDWKDEAVGGGMQQRTSCVVAGCGLLVQAIKLQKLFIGRALGELLDVLRGFLKLLL
jgi:hypothetical protein